MENKSNKYTTAMVDEKFSKVVKLIQKPENYLSKRFRSYNMCDE